MGIEYLLGKRELISFSDTESSFGVFETPSVLLSKDAKVSPNSSNNWQEVKGAGTDSVTIDVHELGVKDVNFNLSFVPQNWKFLKHVLCESDSDVTDTDAGSYYTHTFTNGVTVNSFSLERAVQATTDRVRRYVGCQVNNFSVNFDASGGGFVNCSADVIARDVSNGTSTTSLSADTNLGFKARQATLTIDGGVETKVKNGNFSIALGLDEGRYANYDNDDRLKSESGVTTRRVSGSLNINLVDDTYFDLWEAITKVSGACSLKLTRGTNDDVNFTFTDFYVNNAPDPTNLDGIDSVTVNFVAKDVSCVVNDDLSDYETFS